MRRGVRDHKHDAVESEQLIPTDAGEVQDVLYPSKTILCQASLALASMRCMCHEEQGKEGSQKEFSEMHNLCMDKL